MKKHQLKETLLHFIEIQSLPLRSVQMKGEGSLFKLRQVDILIRIQ